MVKKRSLLNKVCIYYSNINLAFCALVSTTKSFPFLAVQTYRAVDLSSRREYKIFSVTLFQIHPLVATRTPVDILSLHVDMWITLLPLPFNSTYPGQPDIHFTSSSCLSRPPVRVSIATTAAEITACPWLFHVRVCVRAQVHVHVHDTDTDTACKVVTLHIKWSRDYLLPTLNDPGLSTLR